MKLKNLFTINAIVAVLFGLAFVFMPATLLSYYGVKLSAAGLIVAQLLGAAYIGYSLLTWLARNKEQSEARKAIVLAMLVSFAIGLVVSLIGQFSGELNALGWLNVVIFLFFTLGYGYFQFINTSDM